MHVVFADFRKTRSRIGSFPAKLLAMHPAASGSVRLQPVPKQPIKTLVEPGMAHSGLVSDKLQGTMRSRTFVIDKKQIHYRVLGHKGQVNLIIDGYTLIRDPIYGGLTFRVDHGDKLQWRTMDVSMWRGHRAYIELVDEGPGYLGVEQIVFNDGGPASLKRPGDQSGPEAKESDLPRLEALLHDYQGDRTR